MVLETLSRIVQIVTMDVEPTFEGELNRWYDDSTSMPCLACRDT